MRFYDTISTISACLSDHIYDFMLVLRLIWVECGVSGDDLLAELGIASHSALFKSSAPAAGAKSNAAGAHAFDPFWRGFRVILARFRWVLRGNGLKCCQKDELYLW